MKHETIAIDYHFLSSKLNSSRNLQQVHEIFSRMKPQRTLVTLSITKAPMTRLLETRHSNGRSANGSWMDCSTFSHSLRLSSWFSALLKMRATITVGKIATARVTTVRTHLSTRKLRKPDITNCPATVKRHVWGSTCQHLLREQPRPPKGIYIYMKEGRWFVWSRAINICNHGSTECPKHHQKAHTRG